jgi:gamma-glutamylcyclotransferase (GGCT)/AIG2-like uncharacterized protein YtfP
MSAEHLHLFVYGTLQSRGSAAELLAACELVGPGKVAGILYDIDGEYPALVLYGTSKVSGEIWRCPTDMLLRLDAYEATARGLFRRVAVSVESDSGIIACWAYVAGPLLARKLTPARRIDRWNPKPGAVASES